MAFDSHGNLIKLTVTVAPSPATTGTTLSVSNADAAKLSAQSMVAPFNLVVCPSSGVIDPTTSEIIRVTVIGAADSGGTGNTQLTITRQAEAGGVSRTIVAGDIVYYTATKKTLTDLEAMNAVSLVTGETPGGSINGTNTSFTTAAVFNSGSLRVFQNGIRLKGGGVDYTENSNLQGFTMVTAPLTNDILTVDYNGSNSTFAVGANAFIYNDTPSGSINGTNTVFTTTYPYVGGTTQVYRDGQLMQGGGNDYTETTPGSGTITFTTAPATGSIILVTYQKSISTAGNASTVGGYSANGTPTANQIPVLDSNGALFSDGWTPTQDTLVYVSANSFKITGVNRTAIYQKGTRIKCVNNGTTFYGTVISSSFSTDTTVNLAPNNDFALASGAITAPYYSYAANPQGYPTWFNWTPTYSASGSMTFTSVTTSIAKFSIVGSCLYFLINFIGTVGGTPSSSLYFTVPVSRLQTVPYQTVGTGISVVSNGFSYISFFNASQTQLLANQNQDAAYTSGSNNGLRGTGCYDF